MTGDEARNERAFRAIEALLQRLHPKEDAHALTQSLREQFVSADALFHAGAHMLERAGLKSADALLLSHLPELSRCMQRARVDRKPRLDRLDLAAEYLAANFYGLQVERFYMLCLDLRGRMKERVLLQEGTSDSALFSLKAMLAELVRVNPCAVILSHNHPGRTLRPSQADVDCTMEALRALTAVGVPLLDHVIIAGDRAVSLRANGYIPAGLWLAQNPQHRQLRLWLEPSGEAGAD